MASSSIANFLSLFIPSKPPQPKAPSPILSLSSDPKQKEGFTPLVTSRDDNLQYPVSTPSSSLSSYSCPADVTSVVCPSLAYANTLFFRSGYNVQVIVDDNEPEEKLLGRFRREVMRAGVIQECKRRRFFENKQDKEKRKTREAAKRNRRRRTPFRGAPQDKVEGTKSKKEDDDDNWELPEGGLPN
ncbi:hypothetical protein RJ639_030052 [Escallonia herrerae]|uniref:30S ribosomal protein S21, chloroplastic n=1 Tax=Escallonia herrerae TaxID=1293975 RepID=A0AA88WY99_9ASTE|nr:hypothetical protein RJ639_030052 [Escallonia herrerae]